MMAILRLFKYTIGFFFCFLAVITQLQAQSALFKNYTVKDGLPSSEVYHVMQDSKGYIWFATDHGVCRFDGKEFKSFSVSDGMPDPDIFECIEDYKGRIWFRSLTGKLSYFFHDSIFRLPVNDTLLSILKGRLTTSISVDSADNIYIGAHNLPGYIKINMMHPKDIAFKALPKGFVYIAKTKSQLLLSGNTMDPATSMHADLHLISINPSSFTTIKAFEWDWRNMEFYHSMIHDQFIKIGNNNIAGSMVCRFLIMNDSMISYFHDFKSDIIKIFQDKSSAIWIILQNGQLAIYKNNCIVTPEYLGFLKDAQITSVCNDNEGGFWFTSLNRGVYYISSSTFKIWDTENGLSGNKVNSLTVTSDSSILLTYSDKSVLTLLKKDTALSYRTPQISESSVVTNILLQNDGTVWVGNTLSTLVLKNLSRPEILASNNEIHNFEMLLNADTSVWVCGRYKLYLLKRIGKKLIVEKEIRLKESAISISRLNDATLWIGTRNGLWQYSKDSLINEGTAFPSLRRGIADLKYDCNGNLWAATNDTGIIIQTAQGIQYITIINGLLSNSCNRICFDKWNNAWIGSNKGLSHLFLSYNEKGQPSLVKIEKISNPNLNEITCLTTKDNTVYVGTNNGLISFNMNDIETNKTPPPIYITGIKINNKSREANKKLELNYDENYLSVNFVGLTYKNAGNTTYRYKMDGIDTGWVYTKNTDIQYPKLAPGSYTFKVAAMNNDGVWSTQEASLFLHISPPLWATWWAWSLYVLLIAGFIYWRFKLVESRAKRSAEINKQLISMELRELKKQIDPHFLFNNLNTLTHLVEVKSDDAPEFVVELSKYYRYSLQFRNTEFTALDNEIKQAERYLHILKIRFGNHITATWNINDKYRQYLIATYSLQLLFENITKHNIVSADKPLWVEVYTTEHDTLVVKNKLQPKNSSALSTGHGLKSIDQRYRLLTAKQPIITKSSDFFSVELPLISIQDYEGTLG